ncbi:MULTISPECIES: DUF4184 family protein [unclassified Mucilaginibacter]|uniref:DUF4184 family protein n=1 Tax=unclassified Mucilaginibacter TaxID=2617802 RepID=UPI002AC912F1|nr:MULTISPECIES: DUF4184 family protein [unclassified Mucilaginibacter]MEB0260926.1 DUF4184 family protein [Mucilaginibacter sp. 10I4]MEB0279837.1 DUF4184 family protein [Mucilaginibacter sp. 10B2]MEB0302815.1 DUF4184 family protein [Mucilaginibacter sp. 5C4]WPX24191.1 DUF4184 family protein [Mucilaginibacter sp. 5C4]
MPFTISHPAVILPLNYLPKRFISLTALVVGSLTPDFEYFIRMKVQSDYSHTLPGLFWFDLPLGILLMLIYKFVVKDKLINNLPLFLKKRFSFFKDGLTPTPKYYFPVVIVSLIIGAASHLLWDSFTHPTGYFVEIIPGLKQLVYLLQHKFFLYNIIQHLSSLIGGCIIIITIVNLPKLKGTRSKQITTYWIKAIITMLVVTGLRFCTGLNLHRTGDLIVTIISGALLGLMMAAVFTKSDKHLA